MVAPIDLSPEPVTTVAWQLTASVKMQLRLTLNCRRHYQNCASVFWPHEQVLSGFRCRLICGGTTDRWKVGMVGWEEKLPSIQSSAVRTNKNGKCKASNASSVRTGKQSVCGLRCGGENIMQMHRRPFTVALPLLRAQARQLDGRRGRGDTTQPSKQLMGETENSKSGNLFVYTTCPTFFCTSNRATVSGPLLSDMAAPHRVPDQLKADRAEFLSPAAAARVSSSPTRASNG